jgi:subtilisin family serine protease
MTMLPKTQHKLSMLAIAPHTAEHVTAAHTNNPSSVASCSHAGVSSSEQDVPRFLHMRPSVMQQNPSSSSTAAAASRRRRLMSASARRSTAAAVSPVTHLAGHWHTSSSFRPSQYDIWGNSIGDQQCASNDTQLADAAGAEVLPWGIKAIGATNETLLKAQQKGRAIVCIIDSGLARDHAEYTSFPGQLSGCQAGANCPYDWSKDIVGHGTHVAGGLMKALASSVIVIK